MAAVSASKTSDTDNKASAPQAAKGGVSYPAVPVLQQQVAQLKPDVLQEQATEEEPLQTKQFQLKANDTGMPDNLRSGVENLSGFSMSDVKVHYNSPKPAQLQALAYAQGTDIHVGPGQEKHLPHEAWHVVQQKQGRVQPTMQMKSGVPVNDDKALEAEADVMGLKALQTVPATQTEAINTSATASIVQGMFIYPPGMMGQPGILVANDDNFKGHIRELQRDGNIAQITKYLERLNAWLGAVEDPAPAEKARVEWAVVWINGRLAPPPAAAVEAPAAAAPAPKKESAAAAPAPKKAADPIPKGSSADAPAAAVAAAPLVHDWGWAIAAPSDAVVTSAYDQVIARLLTANWAQGDRMLVKGLDAQINSIANMSKVPTHLSISLDDIFAKVRTYIGTADNTLAGAVRVIRSTHYHVTVEVGDNLYFAGNPRWFSNSSTWDKLPAEVTPADAKAAVDEAATKMAAI